MKTIQDFQDSFSEAEQCTLEILETEAGLPGFRRERFLVYSAKHGNRDTEGIEISIAREQQRDTEGIEISIATNVEVKERK